MVQRVGVSWYSVRKGDVTWAQHSGGLPGYSSNACFDRATLVGAIVLVNGAADASSSRQDSGRQASRWFSGAARTARLPRLWMGGGSLVRLDPVT